LRMIDGKAAGQRMSQHAAERVHRLVSGAKPTTAEA
jgi:hypothetical protein